MSGSIVQVLAFLTLLFLACRSDPVIDVDVSSDRTFFQFVAGRDSEGVAYRCEVGGSPSGLTWRYGGADKGNPLITYEFYGEYRTVGNYTIECHSSAGRVGDMTLCIKDDAKLTVEYSGTVRTFSRIDMFSHSVLIPLNTQNIVFTCQLSNGFLIHPTGIIGRSENPSFTLAEINNTVGIGVYECSRVIDVTSFPFTVIDAVVSIGVPPTTTVNTTPAPTTNIITTTTPAPTTNITTTTPAPTTNITTTTTPAPTTNIITTTTTPAPTTNIITTTTTPAPTTNIITTTPSTPTLPTTTHTSTVKTTDATTYKTSPTTTTKTITTITTTTSTNASSATLSNTNFTSKSKSKSTETNQQQTTSNSTKSPNRTMLSPYIPISIVVVVVVSVISLCSVVVISLIGVKIWHKRRKPHAHTKLTTEPPNPDLAPTPLTGIYYELDSYQDKSADKHAYYEIVDTGNHFTDLRCEIQNLTADSDRKLIQEFEYIPSSSNRSMDTARLHRNVAKNRYRELLPYDHTRVVLSGPSDYINASFVPLGQEPNAFIATQGPLPDTVADMWHMIVENNVNCVVQLTDPVENGRRRCELYWPECQESGMEVAGIKIELVEEVCEGEWTRKEFVVHQSGNTSTLTQFHFTGWRDCTVPPDTSGFIEMLQGVKERHTADTPICVVCTSGVGRTGVFILTYTAMEVLESGGTVCPREVVRTMRQHRAHLVQTVAQYKLAYLCLLEASLGKVLHSIPDGEYAVARVEQEFSYLELLDSVTSCGVISDALRPENQPLNSHTSSLPYDTNRVTLSGVDWHRGDYINASHVTFRGVKTQFIAAMNPQSHTSAAFLQMLWQTSATSVVALVTVREWEEIVSGVSAHSCYWPEEGLRTDIDRFSIETLRSERVGNLIKQTLRLSDTFVSQSHLINHFVLMEWVEVGTPSHLVPVVQVAGCVADQETVSPVVVHCSDAIGKTGVFLVLCGAIGMLRQGKGVSVVQLVKRARTQRRHMVHTKEQYGKCYELISEQKQLATYQNLLTERMVHNT